MIQKLSTQFLLQLIKRFAFTPTISYYHPLLQEINESNFNFSPTFSSYLNFAFIFCNGARGILEIFLQRSCWRINMKGDWDGNAIMLTLMMTNKRWKWWDFLFNQRNFIQNFISVYFNSVDDYSSIFEIHGWKSAKLWIFVFRLYLKSIFF